MEAAGKGFAGIGFERTLIERNAEFRAAFPIDFHERNIAKVPIHLLGELRLNVRRRRRIRARNLEIKRHERWELGLETLQVRNEAGHLLEHLYREVRAPRIYEGASEVQREIIARELFKETV